MKTKEQITSALKTKKDEIQKTAMELQKLQQKIVVTESLLTDNDDDFNNKLVKNMGIQI